MNANCLNQKNIEIYLQYLKEQEKSTGTLEKYKRELYELLTFLSGKNESKEELISWKAKLEQKYCPAGVNGRLVAANGFFCFCSILSPASRHIPAISVVIFGQFTRSL